MRLPEHERDERSWGCARTGGVRAVSEDVFRARARWKAYMQPQRKHCLLRTANVYSQLVQVRCNAVERFIDREREPYSKIGERLRLHSKRKAVEGGRRVAIGRPSRIAASAYGEDRASKN